MERARRVLHSASWAWLPGSSTAAILTCCGTAGMLWALLAIIIGTERRMPPHAGVVTALAFWPLYVAYYVHRTFSLATNLLLVILSGIVGGLFVGVLVVIWIIRSDG